VQAATPGMVPLQVAGRKQRELYVGNLLQGVVTADMVKEFFISTLTLAKGYSPTMGPPVACVQMSGDGKFAFVEFRDELMAVTALQLDKVELSGRPLNVGRPAGFIPPSAGLPQPTPLQLPSGLGGNTGPPPSVSLSGPGGIQLGGTTVTPAAGGALASLLAAAGGAAAKLDNKKQRELYVGNLPVGMITPQALKDLFTAPLRTLPNHDESQGPPVLNVDLASDGKFAFVEFRSEEIAQVALTLFDKMEVVGRTINVGRPRGYIEPGTNPAGLPFGVTLPSSAAPPQQVASPVAAAPPAPTAGAATTCLRLNGLITPDMLTDEEYDDVLEDIRQECATLGTVLELKIPREGSDVGACFVRYQSVAEAAAAGQSLDGRQFDGNKVTAKYISEDAF